MPRRSGTPQMPGSRRGDACSGRVWAVLPRRLSYARPPRSPAAVRRTSCCSELSRGLGLDVRILLEC